MNYVKKIWNIFDNYALARWQNRPSAASFWYLPEPPTITSSETLEHYKKDLPSPHYLLDYRAKLQYGLENAEGIIVLPYGGAIGEQLNPEAAFQYALGLHDQYHLSKEKKYLDKFWHYARYFKQQQTEAGLWAYQFDWYGSKAPWYSALAQGRGAAVMLRAWLLSGDEIYRHAACNALSHFTLPIQEGGFLHYFPRGEHPYFEEYPHTPTGVINGFMATLLNIWELAFWLQEKSVQDLWNVGIKSLEAMLPHYSNGWWSLYDLDEKTPVENVNSPRYHLLEIHYLRILSILSNSPILQSILQKREQQYQQFFYRQKALGLKLIRKVLYK